MPHMDEPGWLRERVPTAQVNLVVAASSNTYALAIPGPDDDVSNNCMVSFDIPGNDGTVFCARDCDDGNLIFESATLPGVFLAIRPRGAVKDADPARLPGLDPQTPVLAFTKGADDAARFSVSPNDVSSAIVRLVQQDGITPGWKLAYDQDLLGRAWNFLPLVQGTDCLEVVMTQAIPRVAFQTMSGVGTGSYKIATACIPGFWEDLGAPVVQLESTPGSGIFLGIDPVNAAGTIGAICWIKGFTALTLFGKHAVSGGAVLEVLAAPGRYLTVSRDQGADTGTLALTTKLGEALVFAAGDSETAVIARSARVTHATVQDAVAAALPDIRARDVANIIKSDGTDRLVARAESAGQEGLVKALKTIGASREIQGATPEEMPGLLNDLARKSLSETEATAADSAGGGPVALETMGCFVPVDPGPASKGQTFAMSCAQDGTSGFGVPVPVVWKAGQSSAIANLRSVSSMMRVEEIHAAIAAHGPVLHLHSNEQFEPCSVEWFLERSILNTKDANGNPLAIPQPKADALATGVDAGASIALDPALISEHSNALKSPNDARKGDISTAKAYVRAYWDGVSHYTDLQFWFFYAYNGPGTARLRTFQMRKQQNDSTTSLWPLGDHQADWELCIVRISHATLEPCAVFLSQHDSGEQFVGEEAMKALSRTPSGQIKIFASLNGHATYSAVGDNYIQHQYLDINKIVEDAGLGGAGGKIVGEAANILTQELGIEFALINATEETTRTLDCAKNYELISTSWNDQAVPEPAWVSFPGRWGRLDPKGVTVTSKTIDKVLSANSSVVSSLIAAITPVIGGPIAAIVRTAGVPIAEAVLPGLLKHGLKQDTTGPTGPNQKDEWKGVYGFPDPKPPVVWRPNSKDLLATVMLDIERVALAPITLAGELGTKAVAGLETAGKKVVGGLETAGKAAFHTFSSVGHSVWKLFHHH